MNFPCPPTTKAWRYRNPTTREIPDMDALPSGPQEVEMPPAAPPRSEPAPAPVEPTSKVEQAAPAAPPVTTAPF
jgi:hypothetical protein